MIRSQLAVLLMLAGLGMLSGCCGHYNFGTGFGCCPTSGCGYSRCNPCDSGCGSQFGGYGAYNGFFYDGQFHGPAGGPDLLPPAQPPLANGQRVVPTPQSNPMPYTPN